MEAVFPMATAFWKCGPTIPATVLPFSISKPELRVLIYCNFIVSPLSSIVYDNIEAPILSGIMRHGEPQK